MYLPELLLTFKIKCNKTIHNSNFPFSTIFQDIGCGILTTPFGQTSYANVSAGVANIQELRDLALRPLLAQTRVSGSQGNALARTVSIN
jgi:hypothetical protein